MGNAANPSAEILRRKTTCAANETSHDSNMPTSAAPNIDTNASLGAHLINTKATTIPKEDATSAGFGEPSWLRCPKMAGAQPVRDSENNILPET